MGCCCEAEATPRHAAPPASAACGAGPVALAFCASLEPRLGVALARPASMSDAFLIGRESTKVSQRPSAPTALGGVPGTRASARDHERDCSLSKLTVAPRDASLRLYTARYIYFSTDNHDTIMIADSS